MQMYYCHLCGERIQNQEAYIGTKEEKLIYSCFNCYISTLKPIEFDDEKVRYPLVGIRNIQLHDSIVFYNQAGKELARCNRQVQLNSFSQITFNSFHQLRFNTCFLE
mgnify:CR=1 FL=1